MWIRNFIDDKKLTKEIRKDLKELGDKNPRVVKELKDTVYADMEMFGSIAIRRYCRDKATCRCEKTKQVVQTEEGGF
jgi:hypothetical protein